MNKIRKLVATQGRRRRTPKISLQIMAAIIEMPDLVLLHIASFLCPKDIVHFAETCTRTHSVLPRFLMIKGKDFKIEGPIGGHWEPEKYFDGPPLRHRVKQLSMSVGWKDQGFGNRKGQLFIHLMRGQRMIAEKRAIFGIAQHRWLTAQAVLTDHTVVTMAEPGDFFRFMRNAGGGGGHSLTVKDFRVLAELIG